MYKIKEKFENSKYSELYKKFDHKSKFHKEGSVYNHVMMVYDYVLKTFKDDEDFEVLKLGAICHDLGKIYTCKFNEAKNRNTFSNHENVGFLRINDFLNDLNIKLDGLTYNKLVKIIAYHDVYKYDIDTLKKMFKYNDLLLLLKFTECDNNGRICDIEDRHDFYSWKDLEYYEIPECNKKATITVLIGLPGAGKSSFCHGKSISRDEFIEDFEDFKNLSLSYREKWDYITSRDLQSLIDKRFEKRFRKFLEEKESFILDETNLTKKGRNRKLIGFNTKDFKKRFIIFTTSVETCIERRKGFKKVDESVIIGMSEKFCAPTLLEADEIIII